MPTIVASLSRFSARTLYRPQLHAARAQVLDAAYARHPERFVRKPPVPPKLPVAAWINKPKQAAAH
jgi:hypothetical protein